MKAWYTHNPNAPEEGGQVVWAETRGKAKARAFRMYRDELFEEFCEVRLRREPRADGVPHGLTGKEWLEWGYWVRCFVCDEVLDPQEEDYNLNALVFDGEAVRHQGCPRFSYQRGITT